MEACAALQLVDTSARTFCRLELRGLRLSSAEALPFDMPDEIRYPVVIITCVHYLGPPGPFSFPDSRDLLEVLGGLSWQRERGGSLGDPPGP